MKRYSEFITFPISLYKKTQEVVEEEDDEEDETEDETKEGEEKKEGDLEVEEEEEEKPAKTETVETWGWHRVNNNVAIWSREQSSITNDEYQNFYKAISKETSDAQGWIHFRAEGEVEFKSIMYIPGEANNLYEDYNSRKAGMRLYVRKVLIQDDFEDLLPRYLNFIKGVVDRYIIRYTPHLFFPLSFVFNKLINIFFAYISSPLSFLFLSMINYQ